MTGDQKLLRQEIDRAYALYLRTMPANVALFSDLARARRALRDDDHKQIRRSLAALQQWT